MLEVVFNDSEKASMVVAKNYDERSMQQGIIGYIGEEPTEAERKEYFQGQAIGGSPEEVVNIGFSLDIGDISGTIDGEERQSVFHAFQKLWHQLNPDSNEQEHFFQNQRKDIEKLLNAAKNNMPIRIWKSDTPYSICGFYFVCYLLKNIDCEIRVVSLPEKKVFKDAIVSYRSWAEVEPGKFYQFLPFEKQLTQMEKKMYSDYWQKLVEENTPLRAMINGQIVSVPEDFYDFIIENNLPEDDFIMGRLIGKLLEKYNLGIGDTWYALRMNKMIEANKLVIVDVGQDLSHPFEQVLRKSKEV